VWHKLLGAEHKLRACYVVRSLGRGTVRRTKKDKGRKNQMNGENERMKQT
jgi:hypothetical protein